MSDSKPVIDDSELKLMELHRISQHYSYDLTQRLTFFVISIELVFCGYILLNADKLGATRFSSLLFLSAGVAALSGLAWRFCYNQTFHDVAHGEGGKTRFLNRIQLAVYWVYIALTGLFLVSTIIVGYLHLHRIETKSVKKEVSSSSEISAARGPTMATQKDRLDSTQSKGPGCKETQGKATK